MKRKLTLALAVIMAAGTLTGCSGSTPSENSTSSVADESAPAGTTAPVESQTESQTEPAADTSATEPAQETVSEPEIQTLPEEIEFEGFTYKTAGFDNIDPEAPLGETICAEEAKDLVIPEFPFKATPANIELWGEDGKKIFLPESASDNAMYQIATLTIRPDHTAEILTIPYTSYKNTDTGSYYNAHITYENITAGTKSNIGLAGNIKTSGYMLASRKYCVSNMTAHDLPISELPMVISNNIDIDSGVYVNLKEGYFTSGVGNEAIRYDLSTDESVASKAYFYICGTNTNGIDNSIVYSTGHGEFRGLIIYLCNDGTIMMARLAFGTSTYDSASNNYETMPSEELATLDDLRSSDPEFDTAYTAWLDGKMPFMIPLDEYLEKYAADSANG